MRPGSRNVLGRGIAALIPAASDERPDYFACAVDRIRPMHGQPRTSFVEASLAELAGSIEADGLLQPLVVRREGADYVLIAGERRWRAARMAGLSEVPVVVREASASDAFALALVENLQREDLNPLEVAEACRRLIDEYGLTQDEVAQRIGKSRSAVANTLRLLKLSAPAQEALATGRVSEGHARQLVGLAPQQEQALLDEVIGEELSVRETEARARVVKQTDVVPPPPQRSRAEPVPPAELALPNAELAVAVARLEARLGAKVRIVERDGSGQIEIRFGSYGGLEELVEAILGEPL